jgi:hypothetical protein
MPAGGIDMKYLAGCVLLLTSVLGCSTNSGSMPSFSQSATQLGRANFRIVRANARGESKGFALLGILPFVSPSIADANDQLLLGIDTEGRAISLANVTQERRTLYFILFSLTSIVVRAEVIEFLAEPNTPGDPFTGQSPARPLAP